MVGQTETLASSLTFRPRGVFTNPEMQSKLSKVLGFAHVCPTLWPNRVMGGYTCQSGLDMVGSGAGTPHRTLKGVGGWGWGGGLFSLLWVEAVCLAFPVMTHLSRLGHRALGVRNAPLTGQACAHLSHFTLERDHWALHNVITPKSPIIWILFCY